MGRKQDRTRDPTSHYARPRARSKTRSNKPRLLDGSDPLQEEKVLKAQLSQNGLYLANTLGDGNCLFRALSDQMMGNESSHAIIRHQVCEYLAQNADRYSPYVDEDSVPGGFQGHVASMRQLGTYGTDIELTAFSHLYKRSIKVFQPGLVYVIQAEDLVSSSNASSPASSIASTSQETLDSTMTEQQITVSPREQRLLDRIAKAESNDTKSKPSAVEADDDKGKRRCEPTEDRRRKAVGSLYIAYHSWEHYSSVRRMQGPHTGPPNIDQLAQEDTIPDVTFTDATPERPASVPLPREQPNKARLRLREKQQDKRDRAATLTQQSISNAISQHNQRHLAASVALPLSTDASPADTPTPPDSTGMQQQLQRDFSPKHRGRSMSMSSSTSSQHTRQRSRRQSPASSTAAADSPASSFEHQHEVDKSMSMSIVKDDNQHQPESSEPVQDEEFDNEDSCSSVDPLDIINDDKGSMKIRQPVIPSTKGTHNATPTRRGPSSREKKDMKRQRRVEIRRLKGNQMLATDVTNTSKRVTRSSASNKDGEVINTGVRELFI
ncbi:hypothetical protein OIO90_003881 [Microbotryomycetes sp. JL221]|nr:hypothetical protein OIO90_003881 [Microbotryomycetes sp. JL221]